MSDILEDGQNALNGFGAVTMIGRDKNIIQVQIVCGTEAEAKAIIERILNDIRLRGTTTMVIRGTVDEPATAGRMS